MNRFYLIDKPIWISSFDVIRKLRKKLNIKKMWHTWTLDPLASGLVLVATWKYTKLIPYLEKDIKTYEYVLNLSWNTESLDLWEEVIGLSCVDNNILKEKITDVTIQRAIDTKFIWKISQIPPKFSALKINWQRAYKLARDWKDVEIKKREIEVFSHELLNFSYPEVKLRATVSAWSYIRTLWNDLWYEIGLWWYLTYLRRVSMSWLSVDDSQWLDDFDENSYVDIKSLFSKFEFIELTEAEILDISWWKFIPKKDYMNDSEQYFVIDNWELVSVVEVRGDIIKAKINIKS